MLTAGADYQDPGSLERAAALRLKLATAIAEIEAALANRNRTERLTGRRLTAEEYHAWRSRAVAALLGRQIELATVTDYMRRHRAPAAASRLDVRTFAAIVAGEVEAGHVPSLDVIEALGEVCRLADKAALDAQEAAGIGALRETARELACAAFNLARAAGVVPGAV